MLENALNIENSYFDNNEIILFEDFEFVANKIDKDKEELFLKLQTLDLSDAKHIFKDLSLVNKIAAMRYVFSRRIFTTNLLSAKERKSIKESFGESYGSLCALADQGMITITLESQLITRILYIAESMSLQEFHYIRHELMNVNEGYFVIMQVIQSRLNFHKMTE